MKIAYLPQQPHSRFHFGGMKLDHDLALSDTTLFAHSDTLFAALVNSYAAHYQDAEDFVSIFQSEAVQISSLFYYIKTPSNIIHFLPKPTFLAMDSPKNKDGLHKKRNRIKMVSIGVWQNGFEASKWFDETKYKVVQDLFVMTREEYDSLQTLVAFDITRTVISPKSPKRGPTNASIFYQADIEIGGNDEVEVGWYFMYKANETSELTLQVATNIMAYTGVGGEIRTMGRTIKSEPIYKEVDLLTLADTSYFINVSLLNPLDATNFQSVQYYSTTLRGGRRLSTGGYSNVVRMVAEGALISNSNVKGRLVDLGADESNNILYRNGIPFLIPVHYDH